MWIAAQRFIQHNEARRHCVILHLGDHDPSGLDMTRDIQERLTLFGADVHVNRIALNIDQVKQYKLPPNPAKITDSRAGKYIAAHGNSSWELDALEPSVLAELISKNILSYLDIKMYDRMKHRQDKERQQIIIRIS